MKCLFLFASVIVATLASPFHLARTCGGKPADVVFVIDSSSSIWEYDFLNSVLPFVRDVTAMFDVGPAATQSRVGLVTFGNNYYLRFHLNTYTNKDRLLERIMRIGQTGGNTNTASVLNYVTKRMFTTRRGSRKDVDHIVIVLTDGESMDVKKTRQAAHLAHEKGLQVFAIGVGSGVNEQELSDISSKPDSQFKFYAADFKALERIKEELAIKTCEIATTTTEPTTTEPTTTPTTTTVTPTTTTIATTTTTLKPIQADRPQSIISCGGKPADVYFILDSSSSIWPKDFNDKMLGFVRQVSDIFDIGSDKTRVGVVTFSDSHHPIFGLNSYTTRTDLLDAISSENIPFLSGGTNTAEAIRYVRETGFSKHIARPGVAHVAIVITDGMSKNAAATLREAEAAKKAGIYMFAIGVGESVDQQELQDMGSTPSKDYVFSVNNFGALDTIKNILAMKTCLLSSSGEVQQKDQSYSCGLDRSDIVFGFDSFSMGQRRSHMVVDIITSITNKMSSETFDDYRFSVLSNACSKHSDIPMVSVQQAERSLGQMKTDITSEMHKIIKKLRRYAFGSRNNGRAGARKIAVLFLDKSAEIRKREIIINAKRAKAAGVELFIVTLSELEQSFVKEIVSSPVKAHLIQAGEPDSLISITDNILNKMC